MRQFVRSRLARARSSIMSSTMCSATRKWERWRSPNPSWRWPHSPAHRQSKLTRAAVSRAQEFEADGIGVGISARAGFDPYGASRFLTDMQRSADLKASAGGAAPRALDFLSSHPATPDRVKNALANARQLSSPGPGDRDRREYLRHINSTVYCD